MLRKGGISVKTEDLYHALCRIPVALAVSSLFFQPGIAANPPAAASATPHSVMEAYPDRIKASLEQYRRQLEATAASTNAKVPYYLIVPTIQRWPPGSIVRVAFNGGNDALYAKIKAAALQWIRPQGANLQLVFQDNHGNFLHWTNKDATYTAEIRVGFGSGPEGGYWSLVGTESANRAVEGGGPNQESLNLDSFDKALPFDWQAIATHEFGHALGFQHEHQNPTGGCDFRFDDDNGYVPTKDAYGWYAADSNGRRPGLYTYLGGYANYWPRDKVDANLRALPTTSAYLTGKFDKDSIMKYFFPAFMFVGADQSPCYTSTENLVVSAQDLIGVSLAYPTAANDITTVKTNVEAALKQVTSAAGAAAIVREDAAIRLNTPVPH
jgi:hypothetical protein